MMNMNLSESEFVANPMNLRGFGSHIGFVNTEESKSALTVDAMLASRVKRSRSKDAK